MWHRTEGQLNFSARVTLIAGSKECDLEGVSGIEKRDRRGDLFFIGGSDGHETSSYNIFYIPPKSTLDEAMRMIKQFDETGEVNYGNVISKVP